MAKNKTRGELEHEQREWLKEWDSIQGFILRVLRALPWERDHAELSDPQKKYLLEAYERAPHRHLLTINHSELRQRMRRGGACSTGTNSRGSVVVRSGWDEFQRVMEKAIFEAFAKGEIDYRPP